MNQKEVAVTKEGAKRVIRWFNTVRQAERFIGQLEKRNPEVVHSGVYWIDASVKADAAYQKLKRAA
jgi:hypothetical protein